MVVRERSTAYPSQPLEAAVALASKVRDGLGSGEVTREQISPVIGHEKLTGPAASKIAALAHYGLLDKGKGTYRISALATQILSPVSDKEQQDALQQAALRPTLFAKIFEKHSPDGKLPTAIEALMHREYGVTRDASRTARDNLVSSFVYCGLLDDAGNFVQHQASSVGTLADLPSPDAPTATSTTHTAMGTPGKHHIYELPMDYGTANVTLPPTLTPRDMKKLEGLVCLVRHFVSEPSPLDGRREGEGE